MRFFRKVCSFKIRSKGYKEKTAVHPRKPLKRKKKNSMGGPVIVKIIKWSQIVNSRKKFDEDALLELSESINNMEFCSRFLYLIRRAI